MVVGADRVAKSGLKDVFIACVDGLTGFPEAIRTVYPQAQVQLCLVHLVRNSLRYVADKDSRPVVTDLKRIYQVRLSPKPSERWKPWPSVGITNTLPQHLDGYVIGSKSSRF